MRYRFVRGLADRVSPFMARLGSLGSREVLDQIQVLLQHQIDRRVVLGYTFATTGPLKQLLELDHGLASYVEGAQVERHM